MEAPSEDNDYETVPITFYTYFADWQEGAARELGAGLTELDFEVDVSWSEHADQWLVLATYEMEQFPVGFDDLVADVQQLAADHGGTFDGWERPMSDKFLEEEI